MGCQNDHIDQGYPTSRPLHMVRTYKNPKCIAIQPYGRTDIRSYPIKEREFTANRRRVPPQAPEISMMPKQWEWRRFN